MDADWHTLFINQQWVGAKCARPCLALLQYLPTFSRTRLSPFFTPVGVEKQKLVGIHIGDIDQRIKTVEHGLDGKPVHILVVWHFFVCGTPAGNVTCTLLAVLQ
jgi:hypothetical protein